ncbi:MAG: endonuclease YncB(thermonuclease family) [Rickettsiales bacterium]|jgi:endonuclease YncB( thermonuclease family)
MPNETTNEILDQSSYLELLGDLKNLIETSKTKIEEFSKNQLVQTYWLAGKRIDEENLVSNANYHSSIISDLALDLQVDPVTLGRCVKFFKTYQNSAPSPSSLSWSHYKYLLAINDDAARQKLEQKAMAENWNVQKLVSEIKNFKDDAINDSGSNSTAKIIRPTKANYLYKAKIMKVIDGDTLLLNIDLGFQVIKEQRIRLTQIDAAKMKTAKGQKAFKYLRDLCAKLDFVVIKTNKIDIYGRYLGDIFYPKVSDGSNAAKEQVEIFEKGIYLNEQLVAEGIVDIF